MTLLDDKIRANELELQAMQELQKEAEKNEEERNVKIIIRNRISELEDQQGMLNGWW